MELKKEDYVDPLCPLEGRPGETEPVRPIPVGRVQEKLREYEDRSDWPGVERHLRYWMAEAEQNRDLRGQLMLHNELMGFYRKQGEQEKAFFHCARAEELLLRLGMENTVTAGTTWVNCGTVREAFGDPEGGIAFFEKARENYERNLPAGDARLGGLYNNMGLALSSLGRFPQSREMFHRAIAVMEKQQGRELEQGITWLNLADSLEAEKGLEQAAEESEMYLERAWGLLDTAALPRDGYYAFVCEKCAPIYGHYGFFLREAELERRVREIREKH